MDRKRSSGTIKTICILSGFWLLAGCYYDTESELYPNAGGCDTIDVSYSQEVQAIFNRNNCLNCHNSNLQNGNVNLETHSTVVASVQTGKLASSLTHDGKASPMPPGGVKIPACDVEKVLAWISQGSKNN